MEVPPKDNYQLGESDKIPERSSSAMYGKVDNRQNRPRKKRSSTGRVLQREITLTGTLDHSNKEQYDGRTETGVGTDDDKVQGQDGVINRGRSCDFIPLSGQEHSRPWQGSETSFYQGVFKPRSCWSLGEGLLGGCRLDSDLYCSQWS